MVTVCNKYDLKWCVKLFQSSPVFLKLVKIGLAIKARQRSKEMGFGPVFLSNASQTRRLKHCYVLFYVKIFIGILGCAMYVVVFRHLTFHNEPWTVLLWEINTKSFTKQETSYYFGYATSLCRHYQTRALRCNNRCQSATFGFGIKSEIKIGQAEDVEARLRSEVAYFTQ